MVCGSFLDAGRRKSIQFKETLSRIEISRLSHCLGTIDVARSTEKVQEALPPVRCMIWGRLRHREVPGDIPKVTQLEEYSWDTV